MSYIILTDDDKKIIQPESIKIELMNHQKTMINKMIEIENTRIIKINDYKMKLYHNIYWVQGSEGEISTNLCVLGDKVGSGKTLMIITLLTINNKNLDRNIELGGNQFYSFKLKPSSVLIKSNLIIVPNKLIPQWNGAFNKYSPTLKVLDISTNKQIDKLVKKIIEIKKKWPNEEIEVETEILEKEKLDGFDVILISDTMYKRFHEICKKIRFNRILIDEADSIKISKINYFQFNFLWLITGTPNGLFHSSRSFLKLFVNDQLNLNSKLIIKNDDKYIDQSIILPNPKRFKINCLTPRELNIIRDLIPPSILQMINAGNSDQAIRALNCNIDTNDNILQVVTKNLQDTIKNKKIELEAEIKKHYPINLKKEHEQKIKFIENQIMKFVNKYENIKKNIYQLNDTNCPVCLGEFTNPVIVNCCKNMFCFDCLAVSIGQLKNNKCPYCTQKISQNDIHIFQNKNIKSIKKSIIKPDKYEQKEKLDVLLDLVQKKPNGSFLIFAGYQETFNKIEIKLKEQDITYHILKGQSSTVQKFINDFKEKKVKILMLNSQFFGAGMNLQMATDIIMYHRFTKEMEEQIIGRAQRLGRDINTPLNVYYLLHDNESSNIEDKFKFEEQQNIHYIDWLEQQDDKNKIELNDSKNIEINNNIIDDEIIKPKKLTKIINDIEDKKCFELKSDIKNNGIIKDEENNNLLILDDFDIIT